MLLQCDQSSPVCCSDELQGTCKISPYQCPFPGCSPFLIIDRQMSGERLFNNKSAAALTILCVTTMALYVGESGHISAMCACV